MTAVAQRWQFWIDRGGTFTDCIGRAPDGRMHVTKVLSSDRAPLIGIRRLWGLAETDPIPPCNVRMGTTLATNALLERRGAPCGLLITRGFGDLLQIADQTRPELFALHIRKPPPFYRHVEEIPGRLSADGHVVEALDEAVTRQALARMRERGVTSLAIVLLHAYRAGEMERQVGAWARGCGFDQVCLSHEVAGELGLLARAETTVLDAYLTPLLQRYLAQLRQELPGSQLQIMQSSGDLIGPERFRGPNALLSGPAAGVVALAHVTRQLALDQTIGFDMGGTSTDVSRFAGELERTYETRVAGSHLRAPSLDIHTVAAGGGSLCRYDGHKLSVGPQSAGATPGPLCYGHPRARELTLTDVNLALGRILPDHFPLPLDTQRVMQALETTAATLCADGRGFSAWDVAEGYFEIAGENMAEAIRQISVARGHDVRDHVLVVFGGAGGQHACAVARRLGITSIVSHPYAGVLSALGMGVADHGWHGETDAGALDLEAVQRQGGLPADLEGRLSALEGQGRTHLDSAPGARVEIQRRVDLRYRGTEAALTLSLQPLASLRQRFEARHAQHFGYARPAHPIELVTARVEVVQRQPHADALPLPVSEHAAASVERTTRLYLQHTWHTAVPVIAREALQPDRGYTGPLLVTEATGTLVVEPGFLLTIDADGCVLLRDQAQGRSRSPAEADAKPDPVRLEVFSHAFMSIAQQMGSVLQRTALSTNIRDRLDFSCAVFDADGGLVANAPHIPVHLGAMSEAIRGLLRMHPEPCPGDVYATNDPANGGSHLPDITVLTPVFRDGRRAFFVASRGHHADVGGITPGSMPATSRSLEEEGVVLRGLRLVRDGHFDEAGVRAALCQSPHPARDPDQNLADLQAQIAANQRGVALLDALVDQRGLELVQRYMQYVQDHARQAVLAAIDQLPAGSHRFADRMDDGSRLAVRLDVDSTGMRIDFEGTSGQVDGNLNAPRAVTVAAVLYVLRVLVGKPIPLNSGCLTPIDLRIPPHSLLDPGPDAAVAAGNVETSQRIVDVLLGALGLSAASQGTMNNLSFGNAHFGYYETIAGGAGASDGCDGASGVHTHMTNTRITDAEVLESRFPVRLWQFSLRRGSGGAGRYRGGEGMIREIEALAPLAVSILSDRRTTRPFGLRGGDPGAAGVNLHEGRPVPGRISLQLEPSQRLRIETPGGGGFGAPS